MQRITLKFWQLCVLWMVAQAQEDNCPGGWYYYRRHCYHLRPINSYNVRTGRGYPGHTKDYSTTFCLGRGAHPITYRDENEVNNIHEYLISQDSDVRYWTGFKFRNGNFTTDDGYPVRYTNWAQGEPNLGHSGGDCVEVRFSVSTRKSLWYVEDCTSATQLVFCKKPSVCAGSGTYYYGGRCYTIQRTALNQPSAVTSCRLRDRSELISFHSQKEKDVIFRFLNAAFSGTKWLWTGLEKSSDESPYQWVDETFVDYSNWLA
eukprot:scpid94996/ scgid16441/ Macrophage mannose receptor 1; C-type lectin domain family 13 member D; C-type lectin domain family 13 member D-like; Macrophage mannose receptor 1-like protein 1